MIAGVNKPYEKKLIVEGIGFKADVKGKDLVMALGFSHPSPCRSRTDLKVVSDKTGITVSGIDCEKVGQFAAEIRSKKKPEPYLGKASGMPMRLSEESKERKQRKG
jgi:large subunit ribosomal protein L6